MRTRLPWNVWFSFRAGNSDFVNGKWKWIIKQMKIWFMDGVMCGVWSPCLEAQACNPGLCTKHKEIIREYGNHKLDGWVLNPSGTLNRFAGLLHSVVSVNISYRQVSQNILKHILFRAFMFELITFESGCSNTNCNDFGRVLSTVLWGPCRTAVHRQG